MSVSACNKSQNGLSNHRGQNRSTRQHKGTLVKQFTEMQTRANNLIVQHRLLNLILYSTAKRAKQYYKSIFSSWKEQPDCIFVINLFNSPHCFWETYIFFLLWRKYGGGNISKVFWAKRLNFLSGLRGCIFNFLQRNQFCLAIFKSHTISM